MGGRALGDVEMEAGAEVWRRIRDQVLGAVGVIGEGTRARTLRCHGAGGEVGEGSLGGTGKIGELHRRGGTLLLDGRAGEGKGSQGPGVRRRGGVVAGTIEQFSSVMLCLPCSLLK